jgi:hypothetical protein
MDRPRMWNRCVPGNNAFEIDIGISITYFFRPHLLITSTRARTRKEVVLSPFLYLEGQTMVTLFFSPFEILNEAAEGIAATGLLFPLACLLVVIVIIVAHEGNRVSHLRKSKLSMAGKGVFEASRRGNGPLHSPGLDNRTISKAGPPIPMDRRRARRPKGNPVPIWIADQFRTAPPKEGTVLDRSLGGLLISAPDFAGVGTIFTVRPKDNSDLTSWYQIEVRYFRKKEDRWVLGCAFARKLLHNEVLIFG